MFVELVWAIGTSVEDRSDIAHEKRPYLRIWPLQGGDEDEDFQLA